MLHRCFTWLDRSYKRPTSLRKEGWEGANGLEEQRLEEQRMKTASKRTSDVQIRRGETLRNAATKIALEFDFTDEDVNRAVGGFLNQMNEGLREHGCTIEQLPSFIDEIPNGTEKGTYLALDLGGTNMRVGSVKFMGDGTYSLVQDKTSIPTAVMTSKSPKELFCWVARTVQGFIEKHRSDMMTNDTTDVSQRDNVFDLGFTFSHAVLQKNINSGTLIRWSKGFDIDGAVGEDVCSLLQEAFLDLKIPVRVKALINDTVGTLLTQAYTSPTSTTTVLGAVFGTGSNGAYIEDASKITKLELDMHNKGVMIVNSEWGNFDRGLEYLPTTSYDNAVDTGSNNPGFEMFEKRISGLYLGEILRLALLSLYENRAELFGTGGIPPTSRLHLQWGIDTSFMSALESDTSNELCHSKVQVEKWIGITRASLELTQATKTIAEAIGKRSARLSAVALGAVIVQTGYLRDNTNRVDIGVDGSLIELYPGFVAEIRRTLKAIRGIGEDGEARIDIAMTKHGSGVGAALAAHFAARTSSV